MQGKISTTVTKQHVFMCKLFKGGCINAFSPLLSAQKPLRLKQAAVRALTWHKWFKHSRHHRNTAAINGKKKIISMDSF